MLFKSYQDFKIIFHYLYITCSDFIFCICSDNFHCLPHTQLTFTFSKSTIETLEKGVKCVQS